MNRESKGEIALVLIVVAAKSQDTDGIRSKCATQSYRNNYDSIFGKKPEAKMLN